jgi:hypothetical protein
MKDELLESLALVAIILGLGITFFFVLDYEPADVVLVSEDDNAYVQGIITRKSYNEGSGWTYLEVHACRDVKVFYEGETGYGDGESMRATGAFKDGKMTAEKITAPK